jgi:segregation and condensation protein B
VNPDRDRDSLAKRAASWVPPWQRPTTQAADEERDETHAAADDGATDHDADVHGATDHGATDHDADDHDADDHDADDHDADDNDAIASTATPAEPVDVVAPLIDDTMARLAQSADEPIDDSIEDLVGGPTDEEPVDREPFEQQPFEQQPFEQESLDEERRRRGALDDEALDDELRKEPLFESGDEPIAVAPEAPVEPPSDAELSPAIEAILLVIDEPVTAEQLADVLDVPATAIAERLEALATDYTESGRGFDLRRVAGGWRLYTRGRYAPYVERFVLDGQSVRLTQASLETLAVIAYRQPVTRSRISAIRGVNCDGVVRTLVTRGLVEECGTQAETGAFLYRTTDLFLEKLGLDSVDELPPLAPFLPDDVEGLSDVER